MRSPPIEYIHKLVSQTNFTPAIEKWTPGLLEEVRGIAEGAGAAFNDIFAFQLQDEEWWFGQECKQQQQTAANHCSSLGWQGDASHPNLVAQNMDLPDYLQDYQVVLRIQDERFGARNTGLQRGRVGRAERHEQQPARYRLQQPQPAESFPGWAAGGLCAARRLGAKLLRPGAGHF